MESLALQAGMIVTQKQLIHEIWGPHREADTRSLRVFIKNIRRDDGRDANDERGRGREADQIL